ncbi:MAG: Precorrin-3B methylase [Cyanobacteria bacterium J06634_5]
MAKTKKKPDGPLEGEALIKETCRRIRAAKGLWDAHRNAACRGERDRALVLYNQLTKEQKKKIPQQLRIWLRYRSEKYFGPHQTPPAKKSGKQKPSSKKSSKKQGQKTARKKHTHSPNANQKPLW